MPELIDKGSCSDTHPTPLLFVHGAWHAAWCWDEHFLDFFADNGYRALAVSLRGHGGSSAPKPIRTLSIADYVDDVVTVAERLPTPPVVIGHSMGGFVVQKYLEKHRAPAGVLLASIPPSGIGPFLMRWTKRQPGPMTRAMLTGKSLQIFRSPEIVREKFFSQQTPEVELLRYAALLQEESQRISIDASLLRLPHPRRVTTPLLVLGAGRDGCFTVKEVHATARAYGTEAEVFADMGHNMMLEPGWASVAERIHSWMTGRGI
jgi:pimeloyl-ACP methyl ester carboxylesterase